MLVSIAGGGRVAAVRVSAVRATEQHTPSWGNRNYIHCYECTPLLLSVSQNHLRRRVGCRSGSPPTQTSWRGAVSKKQYW